MQEAHPPTTPPDVQALRRRLLDQFRRVTGRESATARAAFDPVRVETELYDAIYGRRTGTVENVAPLDAKE